MDEQRLKEIAKRAAQATTGPWTHETGGYSGNNWLVGSLYAGTGFDDREHWVHVTTDHVHASELGGDGAEADAAFIAAARRDVPDLLAEVRKLREAQRWIPVGERLPDDGIAVLVWDVDIPRRGWLEDGLWQDEQQKYLSGVTHWMDLPGTPG